MGADGAVGLSASSLFVPSFGAVLSAAKAGDGRAFEQFYRVLHRRVLAFARVRRSRDAEGIMNEVFLQVFTGLPSFDGGESQFKAWVFRIARNKLIDEARRHDRRPMEVPSETAPVEDPPAGDDVEGVAIINVTTDALLQQLDVLTEEQRDVLVLRIVSDLTVEAVAVVLGKSTGAVKAMQRRALRTLARQNVVEGRTPDLAILRSNS